MYIELIVLFNIYVDFLIILMTSILLKQKLKFYKLFEATIIGGMSSLVLFLKISILELLIISFLISIVIVKISFGKLKALIYFYLNAIVVGGIIFFVNSYFNFNIVSNYLFLVLVTPIIVWIYKIKVKSLKEIYNLNFQVKFNYEGKNIILNSFLDTGNTLTDPYFNKPVILINETIIKSDKYFYVPYSTITETGIIKAICLDEFEIIGVKKMKNVVIGLLPNKLKLSKIDCLLNKRLLEEYNA